VVHRQHSESDGDDRPGWPAIIGTLKAVGIALVVLGVFGLGLGIGNGRISFGATSTEKPQQSKLPEDLDYSTVEAVYDSLKNHYDGKLTEEKLLDGLKTGLAQATGDPYTEYFNPEKSKEFNEQLSGSFTGIGAELGLNATGTLVVVTPIKGFPADKAGLRSQDMIVSINGTTTSGMGISDAVKRIRGPKGTEVTLKIIRGSEDLEFKIKREDIKIPSVKWEVLDGRIGYITITQFSEDTAALSQKAALEFKDKGVKSVLLDLRGDPGGLLDAAVDVSSLWLPKGATVLQEKQGGVVIRTFKASGNDLLHGLPTAVLIDAGSASASEIVAGALRDNNVARLYGEKSYGKGSVQQIQSLPSGGQLKVTVARWYRPNGENIDKKGIKPDQEVKMTEDDYKSNRDPQKDSAILFLQKQ
jgi:carboxyl-terminal processing protease